MNKNNLFAKVAVWIVIALVLFTVFKQFDGAKKMVANEPSTSYTQFMDQAKEGKIKRVDVQGRTLTVTPTEGAAYKITAPGDLWMVEDLRKAGVQVYGQPDEEQSFLSFHLYFLVPDAHPHRRVDFLHASNAGRRKGRCFQLRQI